MFDVFCFVFTANPTPNPTLNPTPRPTPLPTLNPTSMPTPAPAGGSTGGGPAPTYYPTRTPTNRPTFPPIPSFNPPNITTTMVVTDDPTPVPTSLPTPRPTSRPTTSRGWWGTPRPTPRPTSLTTTGVPTSRPTPLPTPYPTNRPSFHPTNRPTTRPTNVWWASHSGGVSGGDTQTVTTTTTTTTTTAGDIGSDSDNCGFGDEVECVDTGLMASWTIDNITQCESLIEESGRYEIGRVCVSQYNDNSLLLSYEISSDIDIDVDYNLMDINCWIGDTIDGYPTNSNGNFKYRAFPYQGDIAQDGSENTKYWEMIVNMGDIVSDTWDDRKEDILCDYCGDDITLYIVAHAKVNIDGNVDDKYNAFRDGESVATTSYVLYNIPIIFSNAGQRVFAFCFLFFAFFLLNAIGNWAVRDSLSVKVECC